MQQKCEYCGSFINDTDEVCPNCGGVNENCIRSADGVPKTIAELRQYALEHNWPVAQMRLYIGQDYKQPKAFGIYEENGVFYVYKNKADGTRAYRYRGSDEAYAVNEIYQKMHSEIMLRKEKKTQTSFSAPMPAYRRKSRYKGSLIAQAMVIIVSIIIILSIVTIVFREKTPSTGYYHYNGNYYYSQGGIWYGYDDSVGWYSVVPDDYFVENYDDYYAGRSYDSGYDIDDFGNSDYYHDYSDDDDNWNNNWDNDDYWDSDDSWDYGDTDWDSDW